MEIIDNPNNVGHRRDPADLARNGYNFSFGNYLNQAISMLQKDPMKFFGYSFIAAIIASVPFLAYPAYAGFFAVADKIKKGEPYTFDDFFEGFRARFGPLIVASIVSMLLIVAGLFLCILPGIYLAVAYSFVIPFVLFYTGDFWQAMEFSRAVITKNWLGFLGLIIVAGILSSLGVILCFVGLFLTLPIYYLTIYAAYEDIVGTGAGQTN
jgi:uncharacterized membrane protein